MARRRSGRRTHRRRRRRNPSDAVGILTGSAKKAFSVSGLKSNVANGTVAALGWAGVNGLARIESRFGLDRLSDSVGGGLPGKILGLVIKGFNVGVLTGIARMVGASKQTVTNLATGGIVSIGASVVNAVAPMLGSPGESVSALLGDYILAGSPYATAMHPFGMGDYLTAAGVPSMPMVSNDSVYGGEDPYGAPAF